MNWEVQLYVSGKVFYEYVIARDYQDAKLTALSRNPTARVISITENYEDKVTRIFCQFVIKKDPKPIR